MDTYKIHFKVVRSFSLGFTVHSPKLNGFSVELMFGCFYVGLWNRGEKFFGFSSHWNIDRWIK